ncbi:MAG: hypothetical protein NVSMB62_28930 [Acidobacteriaceae bacterium]
MTLQSMLIHGPSSIAPGDVYVWGIVGTALPNAPGLATLIGRVRWGTGYSTQAVVKTTVVIQ